MPRIGGLAIWLAAGGGILIWEFFLFKSSQQLGLILLLIVTPVFVAGLLEDLTRRVSINVRFLVAFVTATFGFFYLDAAITRLAVPGLDQALAIPVVSWVMTCIAVGGVSHAFNIIDGAHGLAAGAAVIAYSALAIVALQLDDQFILTMSLIVIASLLGFLLWNFPSGRIFLGDGGAYAIGAFFAVLAVMLVNRHESVSPWFLLLVVAYPVWETVFSMGRRLIVERRSSGEPDASHLHSLLIRSKLRWPFTESVSGLHSSDAAMANATLLMWVLMIGLAVIAVLAWDSVLITCGASWAFAASYCGIYPLLKKNVRTIEANET